MDPNLQQFVNVIGITSFSFLIALLAIWSLIWKGIALWKAARNGQKAWYVAMLVINTVGILEIIYILFFSKKNQTTN